MPSRSCALSDNPLDLPSGALTHPATSRPDSISTPPLPLALNDTLESHDHVYKDVLVVGEGAAHARVPPNLAAEPLEGVFDANTPLVLMRTPHTP